MTTTLEHPEYAPSPWVREKATAEQRMLVGGELVAATGGATFATVDPATGGEITRVPLAGESDVDRAVMAARAAFEGPWGRTTPRERERLLHALADRLESVADEMAQLEALDQGKPFPHARAIDMQFAIDHLRYYAGWPTKIEGTIAPLGRPDALGAIHREPVGVVGAIIPWNFPIMLAAWKIAPALAAGCAVVLKPAPEAPLTTLRLAELALEVGLPDGALNVVTGDDDTGRALVAHPAVDLIAFTGSIATGREVARGGAANLTPVALELGGKNPFVMFADADVEAGVGALIQAAYFNAGQVCSSASRLLVEDAIHDQVVDAVAGVAESLPVGPGLAPDTIVGPLVSQAQHARVSGYLERARAAGAAVRAGGGPPPGMEGGFFVAPTVVTDVGDELECVQEEIFGPVLVVQPFSGEDDVLRKANGTRFGLNAAVWSSDLAKAQRVASALRVGTVWINTYYEFDPSIPFGGDKQSGYGRDGGRAGLEKFLKEKAVWTSLGVPAT